MLLAVESLSHRYRAHRDRERLALDNFSLHLNRREILGLVGPNGSGKSTLLRILSTIVKPQAGKVEICGYDAAKHPAAVRERIGVVFQSSTLDKLLTIEENLRASGAFHGLQGRKLIERVREVLELFGIGDRAGDRAGTLSGGLQRRAELARAFLHRPQVLLLDEPSSGLDPSAREDFWRALERLRAEASTAIILSTHLFDEAEKCDTLCFLADGRRVAEGSPGEFRRSLARQVLRIRPKDAAAAREALGTHAYVQVEGEFFLEMENAAAEMPRFLEVLAGNLEEIAVVEPGLGDVYRKLTQAASRLLVAAV
jgi:ABC-2 type transport system ATP-binding protein